MYFQPFTCLEAVVLWAVAHTCAHKHGHYRSNGIQIILGADYDDLGSPE